MQLTRSSSNPILLPSNQNAWEAFATFNGSVTSDGINYHMVYRAMSDTQVVDGNKLQVSTIGYAKSSDGVHLTDHKQLIKPLEEWEKYGCEDPRITYLNGKYYIFYTALSTFPFSAPGIRCAVAITRDFTKIDEKHLITPFNAKAMSLFPEKIDGKFAVILTANTDEPPAKISLALFDKEEELWSEDYWKRWYMYVDDHVIPLQREDSAQVEIGAPPILTPQGWLLVYAYIQDYFSDKKIFTIQTAILDLHDPQKIVSRIETPLLQPEEDYEKFGHVPNIVFPSGALIRNNELYVYYGGADTVCCLATTPVGQLLAEHTTIDQSTVQDHVSPVVFKRFSENPILVPIKDHAWEANATFNPAAIRIGDVTYLLYRAVSDKNTSNIGYAETRDGYHISYRSADPIYMPREIFEKNNDESNFGCEDPRVTLIDDRMYMCYTAYDGHNSPRVALTSISLNDFFQKNWHWAIPKLISPPDIDDKDACILPKKINNKYMIFHRLETYIWVDFTEDLHFYEGNYLGGSILLKSRENSWDSTKLGIAAPPIETSDGWVLLYHGIGADHVYRVGAALLDLNDPKKILGRTTQPLLEPDMHYEKDGVVPNVVFPCGAVVMDNLLFIYYGGADLVTNIATIKMDKLLSLLKNSHL